MKKRNPAFIFLRLVAFFVIIICFAQLSTSETEPTEWIESFFSVATQTTSDTAVTTEKTADIKQTESTEAPISLYDADEVHINPLMVLSWAKHYGDLYGVDPYFIIAIAEVESAFDPNALSSAGAMGMTQIKPSTYEVDIKANLHLEEPAEALYTPEFSVRCCAYYVCWLQERLKKVGTGSMEQTAAAYHGGINTVRAWLSNPEYSKNGELDYDRIAEVAPLTANYVKKIKNAYQYWQNFDLQSQGIK